MRLLLALLITLTMTAPCWPATTLTCIDGDGDNYGTGYGCTGPDADPADSSVQTAAQGIAKWGSMTLFLRHLSYQSNRIWYVSTGGNDGTCTADNAALPCQTYAHVRPLLQADDTVLFRGGTYATALTAPAAGTSGHPVVLMSYPGETAKIDVAANPFDFTSLSNFVVDGMEFTNSATGYGEVVGSNFTNVTFRNNYLHHMGRGIHTGSASSNFLIERNVIDDMGGDNGLYLSDMGQTATTNTVRYNIISNCLGGNTFQVNGRFGSTVIDSNIIYNSVGAGLSLLQGVHDSTIRNNLIFNHSNGAIKLLNYDTACSTTGICPYDQINNVFEYNTLWQGNKDYSGSNAVSTTIYVLNTSPGPTGDMGHNTFRNNIIVNAGSGGHYPPILYYSSAGNALSTSTFANNIIWATDGNAGVIGNGTAGSGYGWASYNCTQFSSMATVSGCLNSDPKLTAASVNYYNAAGSFDFHVLSGSPAIGAGTGGVTLDIAGATRAAPSTIGAYEFQSIIVSTPALSGTISGTIH